MFGYFWCHFGDFQIPNSIQNILSEISVMVIVFIETNTKLGAKRWNTTVFGNAAVLAILKPYSETGKTMNRKYE